MIFHVDIRKIQNSEINSSNSYCLKIPSDLAVKIHSRYVLFNGDRSSLCCSESKKPATCWLPSVGQERKVSPSSTLEETCGSSATATLCLMLAIDCPEGQEEIANNVGRAGVEENRLLSL